MNIAVSNIAWTNEEESEIADKLVELGVTNIELAPTKRWDDPTTVSDEEALEYVKWWADKGITVSAFQSMLFARPDLKIFESEENRRETIAYMSEFLRLAGVMGAKRLVFGSPKNRQRGDMPLEEANKIATDFFSELADVAESHGVVLCLEPNAPQYNCDFITTATEGLELVKAVNKPGFGLHLDTACMSLAGDDLAQSISSSADVLKHYHVSAPMLGTVEPDGDIPHEVAAKALRDAGYESFVSIEMRPGEVGENLQRVETAVRYVKDIYNL